MRDKEPVILMNDKCFNADLVLELFQDVRVALIETNLAVRDAKALAHMIIQFIASVSENTNYEAVISELLDLHAEAIRSHEERGKRKTITIDLNETHTAGEPVPTETTNKEVKTQTKSKDKPLTNKNAVPNTSKYYH